MNCYNIVNFNFDTYYENENEGNGNWSNVANFQNTLTNSYNYNYKSDNFESHNGTVTSLQLQNHIK